MNGSGEHDESPRNAGADPLPRLPTPVRNADSGQLRTLPELRSPVLRPGGHRRRPHLDRHCRPAVPLRPRLHVAGETGRHDPMPSVSPLPARTGRLAPMGAVNPPALRRYSDVACRSFVPERAWAGPRAREGVESPRRRFAPDGKSRNAFSPIRRCASGFLVAASFDEPRRAMTGWATATLTLTPRWPRYLSAGSIPTLYRR